MLRMFPLAVRELYVGWSDLPGNTFRIFRSYSPEDEFELVGEVADINHFVDKTVNFYNHSLRYYYKVEGYANGQKVSESETDTLRYQPKDNIANYVIYESRKVLEVMRNPPVFLLIQRRDGTECPNCWNPITKKVKFANCKVCNGTGVVKGYYPPIKMNISHDISSMIDKSGLLDGDEIVPTPINAWIANYPLVMPGDVIVDTMNNRFSIDQVTPRTKSSYVMRQILNLIPIEKGDPVYNVEVNTRG